jgi:two-component system, LuxR family, response regulator FixJ
VNASQGTLFVVDDDPKSRKAVTALARSMKIRCEPFASAEEFLERYEPSLTGCALIDFRLGGMDGLELQGRLQAMGSGLSVIVISAYADMRLAVRALKSGAVAFIEKPYQNDDLADAICKGLDRSPRMQQSLGEQGDRS